MFGINACDVDAIAVMAIRSMIASASGLLYLKKMVIPFIKFILGAEGCCCFFYISGGSV